MNKLSFLALFVIGVVLITLGVIASESISSDISRLFTGEPTDRALWFLIGGLIAAVAGLGGMARVSKTSS